jgi:hypothetical protein
MPEEGRGREPQGAGEIPGAAAEGERFRWGTESLRQKDRAPEGVLESPVQRS